MLWEVRPARRPVRGKVTNGTQDALEVYVSPSELSSGRREAAQDAVFFGAGACVVSPLKMREVRAVRKRLAPAHEADRRDPSASAWR